MTAQSVRGLLIQLTGQTGESPEAVYEKWAGLSETHMATGGPGKSLQQLVRLKLTANGKSAQIRESLLQTIKAGGAVGESVEACLLKTGLTGWS